MSHFIELLKLTYRLPLSLLSFFFYRIARAIIRVLYLLRTILNKSESFTWQALDGRILKNKFVVLSIMTTGPRWNPHAQLATVGPFQVNKSIKINTQDASSSAKVWSIVLYKSPTFKTVSQIGTSSLDEVEEYETIQLKPGKYNIGLRYYLFNDQVTFPRIVIDDQAEINSLDYRVDINRLSNVSKYKHKIFLWMHYYMYHLIKYREFFPKKFVKKEFLPVGNPETEFYFGIFEKSDSLSLNCSNKLFENYLVYLCLLNRYSFPEKWMQIIDEKTEMLHLGYDGFYLIRVHAVKGLPDKDFIDKEFKAYVYCDMPQGQDC